MKGGIQVQRSGILKNTLDPTEEQFHSPFFLHRRCLTSIPSSDPWPPISAVAISLLSTVRVRSCSKYSNKSSTPSPVFALVSK